jgi:hypothetical protein
MERALHYFRGLRPYTDLRLSSLEYARAKTDSRNASLGRPGRGGGKGKPRPNMQGRTWCNNGQEERYVDQVPDGWAVGRITNKGKPAHNRGKPSPLRVVKKDNPSPCRGRKHTPDACKRISQGKTGNPSSLKGIKNPKCGRPGVPKRLLTCPHCGKTGGEPQLKRWHFDLCKTV